MFVSSKEPGAHKFYVARDEDIYADHDKCGEATNQYSKIIIWNWLEKYFTRIPHIFFHRK